MQENFLQTFRRKFWNFDKLATEALQSEGYGTTLLRFACGKCKTSPILWILENNSNAARLYRREGFSETGRRNQIDKGLDEIEFIKQ